VENTVANINPRISEFFLPKPLISIIKVAKMAPNISLKQAYTNYANSD
jgi:hypothetical protein